MAAGHERLHAVNDLLIDGRLSVVSMVRNMVFNCLLYVYLYSNQMQVDDSRAVSADREATKVRAVNRYGFCA